MEEAGGDNAELVVVQLQLLQLWRVLEEGCRQGNNLVAGEIEAFQIGQASQSPIVDLRYLVVLQEESFQMASGLKRARVDFPQFVVAEVEGGEGEGAVGGGGEAKVRKVLQLVARDIEVLEVWQVAQLTLWQAPKGV